MKNNSRFVLFISLFWAFSLLILGIWWIFLFLRLSGNSPLPTNFTRMIIWEGSFFIFTLISISGSMLIFYFKDLKKTKSLQDFFSSLTHELKTPLASIRLQSEVVSLKLEAQNEEEKHKWQDITKPLQRLVQDSKSLENQLDKILQLSRIERSGHLELRPVNFSVLLNRIIREWGEGIEIDIKNSQSELMVCGDEFGIEITLRNLLENTRQHSPSKKCSINVIQELEWIIVRYSDHGEFKGNTQKIMTLFYRHNSKRGSGIGLYLCKKLIEKMKGTFKITGYNPFTIEIKLQRYNG